MNFREKKFRFCHSYLNIENSTLLLNLFLGGRGNRVRQTEAPYIQKGDVIGCILDLNIPLMYFTVNGIKVKGCFKNFNTDGMFYPVISFSAKLR